MLTSNQKMELLLSATAAEQKSTDPARHKCFLSYHSDDAGEVIDFIDQFGHVFIPKVIGVSDEDDFIDSEATDYVMNRIREKYLADSSVTIVLVGKCTWARRYVDWEVFSTLRRDSKNRLSGLLAIALPSVATGPWNLPPRVSDNVSGENGDEGYARWLQYPTSDTALRGWIEDAYLARETRVALIDNSRARKSRSSSCE